MDWSRATEVYQVKRDGVWHDETREQFLRRPFGEQWRVRLVSGVVLAEQGHEHPKRPEANERDGREEKAQAQGEGERGRFRGRHGEDVARESDAVCLGRMGNAMPARRGKD